MKKVKLITILMSLLLLSMFIAGCSDQSSSSEGKVELTVLEKWPEPENAPYFENVVKEFEEANPNIDVTLEAVADEPIKDKLRTAIGGGDAPDILFSWSGEFANKFVRGGAALDITEYLNNDQEWKDSFIPSSLGPYTFDGKNFGIPLRMNGKIFAYNKAVFEQYGLEVPETWEEFLELCEELKDNGQTPITLGNQLRWPAIHYLASFNQKLVPEDVLNKDYDRNTGEFTHEGYVKALDQIKLLQDKGYFNENVNSVSQDMGKEQFYAGEGAILFIETEEIPHLEENMTDDWGIFKMPSFSNGEGNQNFLTGAPEGFIVSSQTEHPDEAIKFLKFLTNKQNAENLVKELGWISPIVGSVNENTATDYIIQAHQLMGEAEGLSLWLDTVVDSKIAEEYLEGVQLLINDERTSEEIMSRIQEIVSEIRE